MTSTPQTTNPITEGSLLPTFLRFVIPSTLSLLAISTASVVDGIFVGRYVGADALAAVNLLIPCFSFLFGLALMFAVGGAVKAGHALGRDDTEQASTALWTALGGVLSITLFLLLCLNAFDQVLFGILGADTELQALMRTYFRMLSPALLIQLSGLVLYYLIRADGRPGLGTAALLTGAACNIFFDFIFVAKFGWGLRGAALATGIAQVIQLSVLATYFLSTHRRLKLPKLKFWNARALKSMAANGFSEWVNESSVCLLIFAMNWMLIQQSGVDAVAAFSVINYMIFISLMAYYGIIDAMHVLFSQNMGAGRWTRVRSFFHLATACVLALSIANTLGLQLWGTSFIGLFLQNAQGDAYSFANDYLKWVWPIFLVNGVNVLICAFLTSLEEAKASAMLASFKGVLLPVGIGLSLFFSGSDIPVVAALPAAEWLTLILALISLAKFWPTQARIEAHNPPTILPEAQCPSL